MLQQSELDQLWDFGDPVEGEGRLRAAAESSANRDELRTQVARALGLQGRFDEGHAVLDATDTATPIIRARIALERGRLHNSAGRVEAAIPLFEEAATIAAEHGFSFLEVDALHMLAITGDTETWTLRALEVIETTTDERTKRWAVSLYNNLGWAQHDAGDAEAALISFEKARDRAEGAALYIAQWAVARCLRTLGRTSEALAIQEALFAEDPSDEYVVEELELLRAD